MAPWAFDPGVEAQYTDGEVAGCRVAMDEQLAKLALDGYSACNMLGFRRVGIAPKAD